MKFYIVTLLTSFLFFALLAESAFAENSEISVTEDLIQAVQNIDIVSLNVLLADGADIDTVDQQGNTPLMLASSIGNPRMLRIILVHNPDIHARNNNGETALMIAAEHGQLAVVQQLIEQGADIYAKNNHGLSPVEIATRNGHRQISDILKNKAEEIISR